MCLPATKSLNTWSDSAKEAVKSCGSAAVYGGREFSSRAAKVQSETDGFQKIIQLGAYATSAVELKRGAATDVTVAVKSTLNSADHTIDAGRFFFRDTAYLIHSEGVAKDIRSRAFLKAGSGIAYCVADATAAASWMSRMLGCCGKAAASTGVCRVFNCIGSGLTGTISALVGNVFDLASSVRGSVKALRNIEPSKSCAFYHMTTAATKSLEIAQKSLLLAGRFIPGVHIGLGIAATTLTIGTIAYSEYDR